MKFREIGLLPRLFVLSIFSCLGVSFVATTLVLAYEFLDVGWLDLAAMDSHLFIFFPTLGILALVAFYTPSCALVDLYWRHVRFGGLRFAIGAITLCALALVIANGLLASPKRSIWEIAPQTLENDRGQPAGCAQSRGICERLPVLLALANLRRVSETRFGLTEFLRTCDRDALFETAPAPENKRFCFASTLLTASPPLQTDAECCQAQTRLSEMVSSDFDDGLQRSVTASLHRLLLPLKVLFLLILLAISVLLVVRHKSVSLHYPRSMQRIEAGVIVGTGAVLFLPFMSQAFVQSSEALFGSAGRGNFSLIVPVLSLTFGVWTMLTVLFFYRRRDKELEALGKLGSALAGGIAVLKYSIIADCFQRVLGSGASAYSVLALAFISYLGAFVLVWFPRTASVPVPSSDNGVTSAAGR
jgi:hypothetical protein